MAKKKIVLHLQHSEIPSHNEYWSIDGMCIHARVVCPMNHPSHEENDMTKLEALRQYALMTSPVEGWQVVSATKEWHDFVENKMLSVEDLRYNLL